VIAQQGPEPGHCQLAGSEQLYGEAVLEVSHISLLVLPRQDNFADSACQSRLTTMG